MITHGDRGVGKFKKYTGKVSFWGSAEASSEVEVNFKYVHWQFPTLQWLSRDQDGFVIEVAEVLLLLSRILFLTVTIAE
jgi:hypothetical protein